MTAKVILNPYANRWIAGKRQGEVEAALRGAGISYQLERSERRGHITELVRAAVLEGFSPILIAGGDGSIGEAVNGLMSAEGSGICLPALGILPLGTANDLVYGLKLPTGLGEAVQVITSGKTRRVDLCQVNERYFINNSAVGIEPYITLVQQRIGWIKGMLRYLVAAVRGIMDRPAWQAQMEWDGGSYEGPVSLVTVGNGPRSGGVFYMSPHADPHDGQLTVVFGYRKTRREMLALLPKATRPGPGSYAESPGMREINMTHLRVHLENPSPAHTDGEIFSTAIHDLEYSIHPGRIEVFMQQSSASS